jgi:hypothetical protein
MRNRGEHYVGGAQKGTRVRWAKDRRSGKGTVQKVFGEEFSFDRAWDVLDDETGDVIRCDITQMRFLSVPNRVKKARYADKHGL